MSKKITHEQIRNHFKDNFNANDVKYEDIRIITEYISQQEKQQKLLELYRELDNCIVAPEGHHVCRYTDNEKYARIRKQIKEKENDK